MSVVTCRPNAHSSAPSTTSVQSRIFAATPIALIIVTLARSLLAVRFIE